MATLPSFSLLLAALLTQGSCLICETCDGPFENCWGLGRTCESTEDSCVAFVGNSLWNGKLTKTIKSCSSSRICQSGLTSVTINSDMRFRSISSCCQNDWCNKKMLHMPPVNAIPNGLTCPSCFNLGSEPCTPIYSLSCTGEDNHCITLSGTLNSGILPMTFTARGCSSASACSMPLETSLSSGGITFQLNNIGCNPAPGASST